ncbi:MAG: LLM class flavin-dependent oxidoreductase, partial [Alphaproteobacteria bacterium]|nr:LLM class flavin-dependent oxidoreductase [Alphaproteobacteria bacterium]
MKVDLFMEFLSPPGHDRRAEGALHDGIEIARAAEAAGIDAVWLAEHHFLGDYCNLAAPDMLLAAIARETSRLQLGFGIVPLPIHDPVRVAERLATLDILSAGRVLWGVGRGITVTELKGFGVEPAETRKLFRERHTQLSTLLRTGAFTRDGVHYELRPRPSPALGRGWMACVSPDSFDLAAELDLNAMTGPFKPWPMIRADLARYRKAAPGGETSYTLALYCEEDHKAARRRARDGLLWVFRKIFEVSRPLLATQVEGYEHYRRLGALLPILDKTLSVPVLEKLGLAAVGDPDHVLRKLVSLRDSGLDRVSLVIGGGVMDVGRTTDCMELLASDVLPKLRSTGGIKEDA